MFFFILRENCQVVNVPPETLSIRSKHLIHHHLEELRRILPSERIDIVLGGAEGSYEVMKAEYFFVSSLNGCCQDSFRRSIVEKMWQPLVSAIISSIFGSGQLINSVFSLTNL